MAPSTTKEIASLVEAFVRTSEGLPPLRVLRVFEAALAAWLGGAVVQTQWERIVDFLEEMRLLAD